MSGNPESEPPELVTPRPHPILDEIGARGPSRFDQFMALALFHPEAGYYASGKHRIGKKGDFLTSVSVGPEFGRLLCRQAREIWTHLGRPDTFRIVEQGADDGSLAADILAATADDPPFRDTLNYSIVEPFPALRARQQNTLASFAPRVRWYEDLAELPVANTFHVSNEFLDAFPVRRITKRTDGSWGEIFVRCEGGTLTPVVHDMSDPIPARLLPHLDQMPSGTETEFRQGVREWLDQVAGIMDRGAALTIDYGMRSDAYYSPERKAGTLSAYRNHRREPDPLSNPGETDITAHVDFTDLLAHARDAGFEPLGYADQNRFLAGLAKFDFAGWEADPGNPEGIRRRRALQTLIHPGLFGADFHCLMLGRNFPSGETLSGFLFGSDPRRALELD